jgi:hypothetical protein
MDITISSELAEQARQRAQAEGLTVEAYVEQLIREDQEWKEYSEDLMDPDHPEFGEVHKAVMEGLEQAERGEGESAAKTFADLRAKYGISR